MGLTGHLTTSMDPYKSDPDEFCLYWSLGSMGSLMTALNLGGLPGCGASMKSGQKWCEWSELSSQMSLT